MTDQTAPAPESNQGTPKSPGQIAYEAYGDSRSWKTANGGDMPTWADQRPELCDAWQAAADAVAVACTPPAEAVLPHAGGLVDVAGCLVASLGHGCLADEGAHLLKTLVAEIERLPAHADLRAAIAAGKGARVRLVVESIA